MLDYIEEDRMKKEHHDKYETLCKKHGVKWNEDSVRFVGLDDVQQLVEKYIADPYLNNIPLYLWDILAMSFLSYNQNSKLSLSEVVCMQKHAARKLVKEVMYETERK